MNDEFKDVQEQQLQVNTRIDGDLNNLQSNLSVTKNDLANIFDSFDLKLNSTQEKQLELDSKIRDHGHGNKHRIDNLSSQITNFTNDLEMYDEQMKTIQQQQINLTNLAHGNDQKINVVWTNLTDEINRLSDNQREIMNFAIVISDMDTRLNTTETRQQELHYKIDGQKEKLAVLWNNLLVNKNLINTTLQQFAGSYADIIIYKENRTIAIQNAIYKIDVNNATLMLTDLLTIKLHPIDDNWKKVKYKFYCSAF